MMPRTRNPDRMANVVTAAIVAVAFIGLLPPAPLAQAVSGLEISLVVLALAAVAAVGRPAVAWSSLELPVPLAILLVMMSASAVWSSATLNTMRDVAAFVCLAAAAWILVQNARPTVLLTGVIAGGGVIVVASLVSFMIDPVGSTQQSSGALEGIYGNRNQLGFVMLQCFTAALALDARSRGRIVGKLCLAGLFFTMILASFSKTSLVAAIVVAATWLLIIALSRSMRYVWVGIGAFGAALVAALLNSSAILDFFGKDETLNGRVEIWSALIPAMGSSPVLGFGFLTEWPGWSAQSMAVAAQMDGLQVVHAHNELLSWWSGTGLFGVAAIVSLYVFVYVAGIRMLRSPRHAGATWPLLSIVMLNVHGIASTSETKPQGWLILMLIVFICSRRWSADQSVPRQLLLRSPKAVRTRGESVGRR